MISKGVIRNRKSKKDRKYNGQKAKQIKNQTKGKKKKQQQKSNKSKQTMVYKILFTIY